MAKYVVGQFGLRYGIEARTSEGTITEEEEVVIFKGIGGRPDTGTAPFDSLADAEKAAARLSHDRSFQELAVFQLVETVKASEPVETADIKKVSE